MPVFWFPLCIEKLYLGTSLAVQWLRLHASNAGAAGSTPGQGTKILHASWRGQIKKKKSIFTIVY